MRYLIFIICLIPVTSLAITGENVRFDFTNGQPAITDDATNACNNQAIGRFDFTSGQPTVVFDATATCSAAAATTTRTPPRSIIWWDGVVLEESLIKSFA